MSITPDEDPTEIEEEQRRMVRKLFGTGRIEELSDLGGEETAAAAPTGTRTGLVVASEGATVVQGADQGTPDAQFFRRLLGWSDNAATAVSEP